MKDFRYEKEGTVIEAFQLTAASRYQEKNWPRWMDPKWLMTVDGAEWLARGDKEVAIPKLGWICANPDGSVTIRGSEEMETWKKVVPDAPPVIAPPADGMPDESHLVAMYPEHVPEGRTAEDYKHQQLRVDVREASSPAEVIQQAGGPPGMSINTVIDVFTMLNENQVESARALLRGVLNERVTWCSCPPTACKGSDGLGCRRSSPLLK
jgi:hypothetical protein